MIEIPSGKMQKKVAQGELTCMPGNPRTCFTSRIPPMQSSSSCCMHACKNNSHARLTFTCQLIGSHVRIYTYALQM